uniref:Uncharacterized protein n=1 Tax=viral metagenome TaxID=1070528 RepID=A0A6C0CFE0_9ZZZZ
MNRAFDYNGTIVAGSRPTKTLTTVKKVITIDSVDRDASKYPTNGDFVIYLPRVYENIVSIRLMSGEFPPLASQGQGAILTHPYATGPNAPSTDFSGDTGEISPLPFYFLVDIEGLNKSDETAVGANKSTYTDSFFAKIPALVTSGGFIEYNDHSAQENIARYSPPIGKLDRLRIRTRLHSQQGNQGFIYWTANGSQYVPDESTIVDYTLALEIEYIDNTFDQYSTTETRIH